MRARAGASRRSATAHTSTRNTPVDLATCNGTAGQQWRARSDGTLQNPESGLCLALNGTQPTSKTQLDLDTCTQNTTQQWPLP